MMAEYIEREALLNNRPEGRNPGQVGMREYNKGWNDCRSAFFKCINDEPAADVAPVVRCKDCVVPHNKWTGCPMLNGAITPPDFYCSYGERKGGDG